MGAKKQRKLLRELQCTQVVSPLPLVVRGSLNLSEEGYSIMEVLPVDPRPISLRNLLLNFVIDLLFCALLKTKALTMVSPLVGGEREGEKEGVNAVEEVSVKCLFQQSLKMFTLPSLPPSLLLSGNRKGIFPEPSVPCSLLGSHPSPHTYCSCSTPCVTSKLTRGKEERG